MFNIEKLVQTCNYLLKKNNFTLNYTKLIKLLYLADKESLNKSLQTITGDKYVSMDNGPVLSKLYDLIMGRSSDKDSQYLWNSRFIRDEYNLISATEKIPQGELSSFEIQILDQIYEQFKDYDFSDMISYVHNNCPEWQKPNGSAIIIKPENILKSIGKTSEEIEWILSELEIFEEEDKVLSSLSN